MPLYEYQCKKCGETTEVLQKAGDKPLEECPRCGGAVVKLLSPPAIQFKGSGWYITDYAKKAGEDAKGKPGKDKEGPKDAKRSGTDGGPAAKPEKAEKPAS
jgi:putative FmdB family regulatory protein